MNELYILRHGIAIARGTPGVPDPERALTPKGERRLKEIGRGLARIKLDPERIITSPLPRARRSAEVVAEELDLLDRLENSLILHADSEAPAIRDWLRERTENRLMIVGHNPALSELISLLLLGEGPTLPLDLKKGALAVLCTTPLSRDRFQLDWTAPPRLLRRLGAGD
jgi:phosphohistidine phosphatase